MNREILSIGDQRDEPFGLIWTNQSSNQFRYVPEQFSVTVNVDRWRVACPSLRSLRLEIPPGWVSDFPLWRPVTSDTSSITWRVSANETPRSFSESITVMAMSNLEMLSRIERSVTIEIRAFSQFEPERYVIRTQNSVDGWGVVKPSRREFEQTYGVTCFRERFFRGLYRSIVFLGAESGRYQGGICTGMARVALERSLSEAPGQASLDEIRIWHGRQLTDRALLASAGWLFAAGPRTAFNAWRRDVLSSGRSTRCFDIEVPRPWRRDIVSALQQEGHTVVPYALKQSSQNRASVLVYDPNDPQGAVDGSSVMTFLLDEDTYRYPPLDGVDLSKTTIVAVDQRAYRNGRTAVLASLASATLDLKLWVHDLWKAVRSGGVSQRWARVGKLRRSHMG